jgi:hypothetical protein
MGIIDRREIEFVARALIGVIAGSLQRAQAIGLPALRPSSVRFDPKERHVDFAYETHPVVSVPAERLGAPLVSYCVRTRLPMARGADKDLRIEAAAVVLAFSTHYTDPPATW